MSDFRSKTSATPSLPGRGRRVLLIVTGGIAAYKSCLVLRGLQEAGCTVRVVMTEAATRFVAPLTFEALSGQPVGTTLWGEGGEEPLDHVRWAQNCELVLIAPATADFLTKIAAGLADDLASTLVAATKAPVMAAPAMNDQMWKNSANQENLEILRRRAVEVIEPENGWLACGSVAEGRLAQPSEIVHRALAVLENGPLSGRAVLVTAGGTREPIDAVRFLGNRSSGRMGMALARAARDLGARVTLLLGPTELPPPEGMRVEGFETAEQLHEGVRELAPGAEFIFMSAAVSDFRVVGPLEGKWKKEEGAPSIVLQPTVDILAELAELAELGENKDPGRILVGFALETGSDATVEQEAMRKLRAKKLDFVVGNRADLAGEGFSSETNRVFIASHEGTGQWLAPGTKEDLAREIVRRVAGLRKEERE